MAWRLQPTRRAWMETAPRMPLKRAAALEIQNAKGMVHMGGRASVRVCLWLFPLFPFCRTTPPSNQVEPGKTLPSVKLKNPNLPGFGTVPEANLNQPQISFPQRVNVGWIRVSLCKTNPIPGRRGRDIGGLAMPEAGTQTSLAHRILDLGFWIMPEAGTHAARNGTGRSGNLTTGVHQVPAEEWRVASGGWRR